MVGLGVLEKLENPWFRDVFDLDKREFVTWSELFVYSCRVSVPAALTDRLQDIKYLLEVGSCCLPPVIDRK